MKKYLLPDSGIFYKANLHCHTTCSDGCLSPEEVKRIYMNEGYSIVAYTDHDVFIPHPELAEADFLPLNGYEMEVNEKWGGEFSVMKACHMCLIALKPETEKQVCFHRELYVWGGGLKYRDMLKYDESLPDFERVYTPECISKMMKTGRENGFFVTYNHPVWSLENYSDYINYHGMHAMEICNYGCIAAGYPDYNEKEYDDILRGGERIFCIAADDNHNSQPVGSRHYDSFGGFTMIKAERLEYETITDALLAGNFYASQGPEIYDLWFENGEIHICCSEADSIVLNTGRRRVGSVYAENGKAVTEASFKVEPEDVYVRLTVTDKSGKHANTIAYFTDVLF